MSDGQIILIAGTLMVAGLAASFAADRLRLPGLVLFLGLGMAIGSGGAGWIDFNDYELARTIAIFALLRGSKLRPRVARTLEGESGFNDPLAVLLVIGLIDWISKPDYRRAG